MIVVKIFALIVSLQFVCASDDDSVMGVLNQRSNIKVLLVDQARDLVTELWSRSFCRLAAPSPIQRLTNGFQFLLQKLESDLPQKSLVEQAYLMWCTGRTHGFNSQGSVEDAEAIKKIRCVVAQNVAVSLMDREDHSEKSLTNTEQAIGKMLQETFNTTTRQQDDEFVASIRTELCQLWCKSFDINSDTSFSQNLLEERSITGIWDAYCKDVWMIMNEHQELRSLVGGLSRQHNKQKRELAELEQRIAQSKQLLFTTNEAVARHKQELSCLKGQLDDTERKKRGLEDHIVSLSPQVQQLQEKLRNLAEAESSKSPEETNTVRSLFSDSVSPTKVPWGSPSRLFMGVGASVMLPTMMYDLPKLREYERLQASQYPGLWTILNVMREGGMSGPKESA